jgi:hypothetical protein
VEKVHPLYYEPALTTLFSTKVLVGGTPLDVVGGGTGMERSGVDGTGGENVAEVLRGIIRGRMRNGVKRERNPAVLLGYSLWISLVQCNNCKRR